MEARIRTIIAERRTLGGKAQMLESIMQGNTLANHSQHQRESATVERKIAVIDGWLMILPEDQSFVIRRHLIDGIDWPRITAEFNAIWGQELARSERTLKSYQQRGIRTLIQLVETTPDLLADWDDVAT